jgi:excisionase family DNA binding protein
MTPITRRTAFGDLPELLRAEEFAILADCSVGVVYEQARRGSIPSCRIGRLLRIPRSALERFAAGTTCSQEHEGR